MARRVSIPQRGLGRTTFCVQLMITHKLLAVKHCQIAKTEILFSYSVFKIAKFIYFPLFAQSKSGCD